jgi:hypothetical protein
MEKNPLKTFIILQKHLRTFKNIYSFPVERYSFKEIMEFPSRRREKFCKKGGISVELSQE